MQKADVLIEALTWIRQFRGKITVIKLGGSVMEDERAMTHLLLDIVFMETVGMRPVVVHGGGAAISRAMAAAGLSPASSRAAAIPTTPRWPSSSACWPAKSTSNWPNASNELGGQAQPLNFRTTNVLFGERMPARRRRRRTVDLGHVGQVTSVDRATIEHLCYAGIVPIIPSMCITTDGEKLNVNADTAATAVARALQAEKLVYLSDVNGVRRDKNDPDSLMHSLTAEQAAN